MPYCPKCGVEVDSDRKRCPLCEFKIPNIFEEESEVKNDNIKFPEPENIYKKELLKRKNTVFYSIIVFVITTIFTFLLIRSKYNSIIINYFIISSIFLVFYSFFCLGYLRTRFNILGIYITSIIFTYFLTVLSGSNEWYFKFAIPLLTLVVIDFYICYILYALNRLKNKFIYVPVFSLLFVLILCLGIDIIIIYHLEKVIKVSWSVYVMSITLPIILIMIGVYHKLPDKVLEELKRRFHV